MSSQLQIRLFGSLEIRLNDATLTNFMSNKAPALLAYLALNPRPQQRDALATLLWSEMSDADAKNNLRQVLTNLRKLVDPHLVVTRDTIGFNHETPYSLDVETFERHLQKSRKQEGAERAEELRQAITLYAGEFLAGFFLRDAPEFEEWMLAHRARLRELALHALHELTQLEMVQGHFDQAIASSSRSLAIDPWREEAHRQLMLALARSGQRSAALSQYKLCQRTLRDELGVEPSSETQMLYERIRAAGESIVHHLPAQATSFVGRWRELQTIERELLNPECRMLTLVGVGGIGKTRLAIQAAERLLQIGAFLNGVFFVPLAALDSTTLIVPAIAEACSFKFAGNREPAAQLLDFLRNQEILLVLDNFEGLLEGANRLGQLLERAPALKLLVTSRERLNLRWERMLPIAEMDDAAAIQLFLTRAQTVQSNFQVDATEKEALQRICVLTGQLPLAIELAAAWVRALSCSEIAEEISQSLDFLTAEQRDGVVRHGSLRALFHSSWQFLSHEEQRLLARLAIFSNGFTRTSAVETAEATTRSLTALMDKSLLQRGSNARYSMHPVVRQYAAEKLATDAATLRNTAQRHCDHFANFLEKRAAALKDSRLLVTSAEIESELDNVRAAWHWAVEQGSAPQLSKMIDAVYSFWIHRGYYQEGFGLFANAVVALQSYPLVLGAALARQAYFAYFLDRFDLAIDLARQSRTLLEISPQEGRADCALAYCVEGLSFWRSGNLAEARQAMHASMELSLAVQDLFSLGRAYRYQGILVHDEGQHAEALKWYKLAEEVDRRQGHPYAISSSLNNMGNLYFGLGDYDLAKDYWEQSLALTQQLSDRRSEAAVLSNLGLIEKVAGRLESAHELTIRALSIRRAVGDLSGATVTLANLGDIANQQGDYQQALAYHRESLTLCRQLNTTFTVSNALLGIGYAFLGLGQISEARSYFRQAFDASLATHYLPEAMGAITGLAQLEYRLGAIEEAGKLVHLVLAHPSTYRETRDEAESLLHLIKQTCNANNLYLDSTPYTLELVSGKFG
ncbi:MAG: BTAD domain-containing putative transcriptional regulator [Caldilineaceae bacterium]